MRDLQPVVDTSIPLTYRGINRANHLRWMGSQPLTTYVLPTEGLRDQIDGPDVAPQRRQFARHVELFERELRPPAPGVTWLQLQRGFKVPMMGGLPTLQQRIDRRVYNEYCEPNRDWQRRWDAETNRIEFWTYKIQRQKKLERASACIMGMTVGLSLTAMLSSPIAWPLAVGYIAACMLSIAYYLHNRSQRIRR